MSEQCFDDAGGGCDLLFDPFCNPCLADPYACVPGGFIGGGPPTEPPRKFPWPALPPLFFAALESSSGGGGSCTIRVLQPNQVTRGFNACVNEGAQLIWAVECTGEGPGTYNCCLAKHRPYQQACETPRSKLHYNEDFIIPGMSNVGGCCKKD